MSDAAPSSAPAPSEPVVAPAWLTGPASTAFYTVTYAPPASAPKAALVFVHGFVEHVGRYDHVFRAWAARGFGVLAFDQRGFGRTALDEAHRSADGAYGKTSGEDQVRDAAWAIEEARKRWPGVPVFLMGHSMGGGVVLNYCTRTKDAPLAGVLVSSPLLHQTKPASKALRVVGGVAGRLLPYRSIPATVKPEEVSRDETVRKEYANDKWIRFTGTLKGISDMLNGGEQLVATGYRTYPKSLPLLLIHGTTDHVTSYHASQTFHDNVVADDKKISLYEGGYHELHNEPDGMKERMIEECISWAEARLKKVEATSTARL